MSWERWLVISKRSADSISLVLLGVEIKSENFKRSDSTLECGCATFVRFEHIQLRASLNRPQALLCWGLESDRRLGFRVRSGQWYGTAPLYMFVGL